MAMDRKYGQLYIRGIGRDEPVFVIRAQDMTGPTAVRNYAENAQRNGANEELVKNAYASADVMQNWQAENIDVVKLPD